MSDKKIERRQEPAVEKEYHLKLFVAGREVNSEMAVKTLREICHRYLKNSCRIELIDVLENYEAAMQEKVIVTPALVIKMPLPRRVIFGNLSDREKVLKVFGIGSDHASKTPHV